MTEVLDEVAEFLHRFIAYPSQHAHATVRSAARRLGAA